MSCMCVCYLRYDLLAAKVYCCAFYDCYLHVLRSYVGPSINFSVVNQRNNISVKL